MGIIRIRKSIVVSVSKTEHIRKTIKLQIMLMMVVWSFSDIIPGAHTIRLILAAALTSTMLLSVWMQKTRLHHSAPFVFWLLYMLYLVLNNGIGTNQPYDLGNTTNNLQGFRWFIMILLLLIIAYLVSNCTIKLMSEYYALVCRCMIVLGTIHAIATILFFAFPDLYTRVFLPRAYASQLPQMVTYMSGLCTNYSRNAMNLSAGFIAAFCSNTKTDNKRVRPIVLGLLLIALMLTTKRAHFVFTVATCSILFMLQRRDDISNDLLRGIVLLAVVVPLTLILITAVPELALVFERIGLVFDDETIGGRRVFYDTCQSLWSSNRLFGHGYGSFIKAFALTPRGANIARGESSFTQAHNQFLQILAEGGILGLSIYILAFVTTLHASYSKYRQSLREGDTERYRLFLTSIGAQLFILMYSITGSPMTLYFSYIYYYINLSVSFAYVPLMYDE